MDANVLNIMENTLMRIIVMQKHKPIFEKIRVKRSGIGKFAEAAEMGLMKQFRMYSMMVAGPFLPEDAGALHPLHRDVPKPVVKLFKEKLTAFLFPPPEDKK